MNNTTSNSSTPNSHNNTSGGSHSSHSVNNSNSNKKSSKNTTNTRNQLISVQQQQLLKNHLDCITDLKITELPYPMLISGDRDGIIKVFM
jgi:phosphoinositide-3-kinase regulatory subunit 4